MSWLVELHHEWPPPHGVAVTEEDVCAVLVAWPRTGIARFWIRPDLDGAADASTFQYLLDRINEPPWKPQGDMRYIMLKAAQPGRLDLYAPPLPTPGPTCDDTPAA